MSNDDLHHSEHAAGYRNQARLFTKFMILPTIFSIASIGLDPTFGYILTAACLAAWLVFGLYSIFYMSVVETTGDAVGRVLLPSGSSTPSVDQHSNIEALEARGSYAEAAEAYKSVIATSAGDVVACEKLGKLAIGELKDYQTAVFAYREAERRSPEPRRQAGYALMVAGIYRDNLKDYGKSMVELRRILAQYPDVPNAARLRAEIDELKTMHFESP